MKIQCPAKVNLFLEVTGKRSDGYNNLATLFAKINLYDVLDIQPGPMHSLDLTVETDGAPIPEGEDNLVLRAARAFIRSFRVGQGIKLHLTKRIPVGAGLGGGSSDAAGTLLGLAKYLKIDLNAKRREVLRKIGSKLGADVGFFLQPEPLCIGKGVGNRLKAVKLGGALPYMVLAWPGFEVSTGEVYKALPRPPRSVVLTRLSQLDKLVKSLQKGKPVSDWEACLFNRLEESEVPVLSRVAQARRIFSQLGLKGVRMTGSGSSVFGFVASHDEGERVLKRLQGYPWKVFLTICNEA